MLAEVASKKCGSCQTVLGIEYFGFSRNAPLGRDHTCKKCRSEKYHANPGKQMQKSKRQYHANRKAANQSRLERDKARPALKVVRGHRYLAKKSGCEGDFTAQEWIDLCARHNQRCAMCGEEKPLTVDHIVPRSKHGANTIDNIQPLCLVCNAKKGDRTSQ